MLSSSFELIKIMFLFTGKISTGFEKYNIITLNQVRRTLNMY